MTGIGSFPGAADIDADEDPGIAGHAVGRSTAPSAATRTR